VTASDKIIIGVASRQTKMSVPFSPPRQELVGQ